MSELPTEPIPPIRAGRSHQRERLINDILAASKKGHAVRLDEKQYGLSANLRQAMHNLLARKGYRFHAQTTSKDGTYLVWASKKDTRA